MYKKEGNSMHFISNLKLMHKIMLMIFAVLVFSIGIVSTISSYKASNSLEEIAKTDLTHLTLMARHMCEMSVEGINPEDLEAKKKNLNDALLEIKIGKTGYIYTIDSKGVLQVHPNSSGKDISNYAFIQEITTKGPRLAEGEIAWVRYEWDRDGVLSEKIAAYTYYPKLDWVIAAGSYLDEFTAPANEIKMASLYVGLACLFFFLFLGFLLSRTITNPILSLVSIAKQVAVGEISNKVQVRSKDEIGVLGESFNSMIDYLQETAGAAERIAKNDLTVIYKPKSEKDQLGISFQSMISNLRSMVNVLTDNSQKLVSSATEIASSSEQMSAGAENQATQVAGISTAVEEMSATIIESANNASEASEVSNNANENASKGGEIVSNTISGMRDIANVVQESSNSIGKLAKSAEQIGDIISVIDDIADQTNLLALNAAIEAARAGEQGRGFAVVADEVRKLAERTGKATGEITGMIKGIQDETKEAVSSMDIGITKVNEGSTYADQAGTALNEIVNMSQQLMDMIQQIAQASNEQSSAADEISKNIDHIATVTKETAQGAKQSAEAAENLNQQAEEINNIVKEFKIN